MQKRVKVIDLFAGPGGLGEGFSSLENSPFEIGVSVEFEKNAHNTLKLRSFFRKLSTHAELNDYYSYIKSTVKNKAKNFEVLKSRHAEKWSKAEEETLYKPHALGKPEKWQKIKEGLPLTEKDELNTSDEEEIFAKIKNIKDAHKDKGPLIVIGGPPCQAYSVNGRNRIKAEKNYKSENDERFFLYEEYLRVLDLAEPDLFVMENVEGILSAKLANGERIFERIMLGLTRPKNKPDDQYDIYSLVCPPSGWTDNNQKPLYKNDKDFVITASKFGVPQHRKRVILLGIKRKHGRVDSFMKPSRHKPPTTSELIGALPRIRSSINRNAKGHEIPNRISWAENWEINKNELIETLSDQGEIDLVVTRLLSIEEKKSGNRTAKAKHTINERVTRSFEKTRLILEKIQAPEYTKSLDTGSSLFIHCREKTFCDNFFEKHGELAKWINKDSHMQGVANHQSRSHKNDDLKRYMFSSAWATAHSDKASPSPKSKHFPLALSPDHANWESGNHADRFRTIGADQTPLTITSHLRKDGHAQIHYDVSQNRSLTVREAARIQTFPDNYYFEGSQGWQFQQVGNAVPAFLAVQIARHVLTVLKDNGLLDNS